MDRSSCDCAGEKGIALVTVLFFLVILTIIGVMAMQSSSLQQRMAGGMADREVALQAAEAAANAGERFVQNSIPSLGVPNCVAPCIASNSSVNGGVYIGPPPLPWGTAQAGRVDASGAIQAQGANPAFNQVVATAPEVIVEHLSWIKDPMGSLVPDPSKPEPGSDFYRITARGVGAVNTSRSVVQSIYAVPVVK